MHSCICDYFVPYQANALSLCIRAWERDDAYLKNNKKNNAIVTAAATAIAFLTLMATPLLLLLSQSAQAVRGGASEEDKFFLALPQAPVVVSGDNIYVAWWNGTAGQRDNQTDVMFRASSDGGVTFGDKINLSNTTDTDSWRVEIAGEDETVAVT